MTVVRHSVSLYVSLKVFAATLAFVTSENFSVLEDLKLNGLLREKRLLCLLKSQGRIQDFF